MTESGYFSFRPSKTLQFLIAGLLLLSITACSAKPSEESGSAAVTASSVQTEKEPITIEYWQYEFPAKVELINTLIQEFETEHPNIKVKQTNFPYDQYNQKVATLVPAGKGPDVINLYYGWLPKYVQSGYLQPLPESSFPGIAEAFFPFVDTAKLNGSYYALPTGVRTLGLFYNKDLFTKAGLDPEKPPTTWEELVSDAKALTETDKNGQLVTEGFAWEPGSQLHHWFRDGLLYQAGGKDTSEDRRKILWNDTPAGLEAFKYLVDFATVHKVGINGFYTDDANAFKTGHAAINVDGSYRLGSIKKDAPDLNFAVAPLPGYKGKSTQASFWANAIPANVTGEKLEAATAFLQFLISKGVQEQWVEKVGELPAQKEVALQDKYVNDPLLGPFISQLNDANAHFFIDETQERTLFVNAVDEVLLNHVPEEQAFNDLVAKTQKLYDDYWAKQDKKK
ncbi:MULTISPECIES: extracellular solute-binding protein [Paenibacillus]|uniref:Carbohydrate ABC transporter substrate-binding protein (CUT1 family) n=1 Tax=Paenibacillus pabuli TaxID=1472 RepID=A0ABX9BS72_9BACL|nr:MULTISPECIES: extracellular solute-binding protein [Paenibacillus]RAJ03055.1 carbohydrate ABC transporter substrate-binding protein (CUT1 family) [Paenibacillus pabuli]SEO79855.1 carbohydrate ABC transporter substrate-binding protein, CUT1 family [Paenibacillus sp. OK076]